MMEVVVTGMGAISALGNTVAANWAHLTGGRHGFREVTLFPTAGYRCHRAAEADPGPLRRRQTRASALLLAAAREALAESALRPFVGMPLSFSTTAGGMALGEDFLRGLLHAHRARFATIARYHPGQQLQDLQSELGFRAGATFIVANSCASGANAIGHARDLIAAGRADVVLAGGFETVTELVFAGFDCLQAQTTDEQCRPFDEERSGLLLGEAAACLVLESAAHARARGAAPLARLIGYGHTTDTHHLTQPAPDGDALVRAVRAACSDARVSPDRIAAVNAHGTATPTNDPTEQRAYATLFGDALPPIRSTKGATGHTLGAAGALEAVYSIQSLRTGALPPQLGLRRPLAGMTPSLTASFSRPPEIVASANLGFGGSNAALLFAAP